ncbi:MAG TPA: glycosyltransferase family 9 protein, partial [Elusimicrobiales bacterium]|nr:glycosyltransferase family 9 protein [Elusimicrobiales bacterium]
KKKNARSYQEIMQSVCGLKGGIDRPVFSIPDKARLKADKLLKSAGGGKLIGLNTGAGTRWPKKMLAPQESALLCKTLLDADKTWRIILLGGPQEQKTHALIKKQVKNNRLLDGGNHNPFPEFAALAQHCDVLVCGDTLALHTAAAAGTPCVALFGPTSADEIYDYDGLILKLAAQLPCLGCYGDCEKPCNCMSGLSHSAIVQAVKKQLGRGK